MIKNKHTLLVGILIMMVQVVWTPALWSMIELNGLHWLFIRLPLVLSMPVGIGLFLSSIENTERNEAKIANHPSVEDSSPLSLVTKSTTAEPLKETNQSD